VLEFYPQIKALHVVAVVASGVVFAARGALVLGGRRGLALALPLRWLSWSIDTVLLTAALMLFTLLPPGFFANGWLAAKLVLLVVYVGLATVALRSPSRARQAGMYVAALAVFALIAAIARAHHPLGPVARLLS